MIALMSSPISISEGRLKFLAAVKGPMTTDQSQRKELIQRARDFERQRKVEATLAWLRQIGVMAYGPATPTPEQDVELIERVRVAFGKYKVLSGDQIKLRKAREVPLARHDHGGSTPGEVGSQAAEEVDRYVHQQFLLNAFD